MDSESYHIVQDGVKPKSQFHKAGAKKKFQNSMSLNYVGFSNNLSNMANKLSKMGVYSDEEERLDKSDDEPDLNLYDLNNVHKDIDIGNFGTDNESDGNDSTECMQFTSINYDQPYEEDKKDAWYGEANGGFEHWHIVPESMLAQNNSNEALHDSDDGHGWGKDDSKSSDNDNDEYSNFWGNDSHKIHVTSVRTATVVCPISKPARDSVLRPWSHKKKERISDDSEEEEVVSIKSYHRKYQQKSNQLGLSFLN